MKTKNKLITILTIALVSFALGYALRMYHVHSTVRSTIEQPEQTVATFIESQPVIAIDMTIPPHKISRKRLTCRYCD